MFSRVISTDAYGNFNLTDIGENYWCGVCNSSNNAGNGSYYRYELFKHQSNTYWQGMVTDVKGSACPNERLNLNFVFFER